MLKEKNLILFFDYLSNRDENKLMDMISEEANFYFPKTQPIQHKGKIIRFIKVFWVQFPKLKFTVQRVVIQGNTAAIHWCNKGMNRKNEDYENEGVTIMEINNDKITYISDFFKNTEKF